MHNLVIKYIPHVHNAVLGRSKAAFTHFGTNGQKPVLTLKEWEFGGGSSESLGVNLDGESKSEVKTYDIFMV